jgi:hypothetical protein
VRENVLESMFGWKDEVDGLGIVSEIKRPSNEMGKEWEMA